MSHICMTRKVLQSCIRDVEMNLELVYWLLPLKSLGFVMCCQFFTFKPQEMKQEVLERALRGLKMSMFFSLGVKDIEAG